MFLIIKLNRTLLNSIFLFHYFKVWVGREFVDPGDYLYFFLCPIILFYIYNRSSVVYIYSIKCCYVDDFIHLVTFVIIHDFFFIFIESKSYNVHNFYGDLRIAV